MMSGYSRSPNVFKGAIVGMEIDNPLASVIVFQYNPDTLTRTLTARITGNGDQGEAVRLKGPPDESISVEIELDAADQLEKAEANAVQMGIYPAISALEMLITPRSADVIHNDSLAAGGIIEIIQPQAPLALFVWGKKRTLPVRITDFTVTEEAFDVNLNPIRASISLSMRVLTYEDLGMSSVGGALSLSNLLTRENMMSVNGLREVASILGGA